MRLGFGVVIALRGRGMGAGPEQPGGLQDLAPRRLKWLRFETKTGGRSQAGAGVRADGEVVAAAAGVRDDVCATLVDHRRRATTRTRISGDDGLGSTGLRRELQVELGLLRSRSKRIRTYTTWEYGG